MDEEAQVSFTYCVPAGCSGIRYLENGGKLDPLCLVDLVCAADDNENSIERQYLQDRLWCLQPSQLRPFGYGLLRHGNMFEDICSYFKKYLNKSYPKGIPPANRPPLEPNSSLNFPVSILNNNNNNNSSSSNIHNSETPRTIQEITSYMQVVLCTDYPYLTLANCGVIKDSQDTNTAGQHGINHPMIFQPVFAEETNLENVSSQLTSYLRSAFTFQLMEHTTFLRSSLCSNTPKSLLADDLGTQLHLLESDMNPFCQPEQFADDNYEKWKQEERSRLGSLLQLIGRSDIPKVREESVSRLKEIHKHYKYLSEKLFLYDKKCLETTGNQPYAYSNYSACILEEFGCRYGVSFLFRLIVYLDLLGKYFDENFSKMKHIHHTVSKIWSLVPPEKENFTATKTEKEFLQDTLTAFFKKGATFLYIIIKSELKDPKVTDSLIETFLMLFKLREYLEFSPELMPLDSEIYYMAQRMFLKVYQRTLEKFCKKPANMSGSANTNTQLTLQMIPDVTAVLKEEVYGIEIYKSSFQFDIVSEAKKCLFKYLMNDLQNTFKQGSCLDEKVDVYSLAETVYQLQNSWKTSLTDNLHFWKVMIIPTVIEKIKSTYEELRQMSRKSLTLDQFHRQVFCVVENRDEVCGRICTPELMGWKHVLNSVVSNAEVIALSSSTTYPLLTMMPTNTFVMSQKETELILKSKQKQQEEEKDAVFQKLCQEAISRNCSRSCYCNSPTSPRFLHLAFKNETCFPKLVKDSSTDYSYSTISVSSSASEVEELQEKNQVWEHFLLSKTPSSDDDDGNDDDDDDDDDNDTFDQNSSTFKCCLSSSNSSTNKPYNGTTNISVPKRRFQFCFSEDYAIIPNEDQFAVVLPLSSSIVDTITILNRFLHVGRHWYQRVGFCLSVTNSMSWMKSGIMDLYNTFLESGILLIVNYARSLLRVDAVNFLEENPRVRTKLPDDIFLEDYDKFYKNFQQRNSDLFQQFSVFYFTKKPEAREKLLPDIKQSINLLIKDHYSKKLCIRLNDQSILVKVMSVYCESLTRIFFKQRRESPTDSESREEYCCKLPHVITWLCHYQEHISSLWDDHSKILVSMFSQFLSKTFDLVLSSSMEKSHLLLVLGPLTSYINTMQRHLFHWLYPCNYNLVISTIIISLSQKLASGIQQIHEMNNQNKTVMAMMQLSKMLLEMVYSLTDSEIQENLSYYLSVISFKLNLHLMPTIQLARLLWSINVQVKDDCPHCFSISKMKLILQMKKVLQSKHKSFESADFRIWAKRNYRRILDVYEIVLPESLVNAEPDDVAEYVSEEFGKILIGTGQLFEVCNNNSGTSQSLESGENYPKISLQKSAPNLSPKSVRNRLPQFNSVSEIRASRETQPAFHSLTFLARNTDLPPTATTAFKFDTETFSFKTNNQLKRKSQSFTEVQTKSKLDKIKFHSLANFTHKCNNSYLPRQNAIKSDTFYSIRLFSLEEKLLQWPTFFISSQPKFDVQNSQEFFDLIANFFNFNFSADEISDILKYRKHTDSIARDCITILEHYFKTS
ncbi:uncharacterized protein LOC115219036 [Argonauta hians]